MTLNLKLKLAFFGILGIIILGMAASTFYTVDNSEYAFLITLGNPSEDLLEPGPKFKVPFVQKVVKVSKELRSMRFGYDIRDGANVTIEDEAKMITGDTNIILVDFDIQYYITDPIKVYYKTDDYEAILKNVITSSIKNVIGRNKIDFILTEGRGEIIAQVKEEANRTLKTYDMGVEISKVNLQDTDFPNEEVAKAFADVQNAINNKVTVENKAVQYKTQKESEVEGKYQSIINDALNKKQTAINKAKGDTAKYTSLYSEYVKNKNITKTRLEIEMMEDILKNGKNNIVIMPTEDNSVMKYFPIPNKSGGAN